MLLEQYDDGRTRWFRQRCELCGASYETVVRTDYCYDCGKRAENPPPKRWVDWNQKKGT